MSNTYLLARRACVTHCCPFHWQLPHGDLIVTSHLTFLARHARQALLALRTGCFDRCGSGLRELLSDMASRAVLNCSRGSICKATARDLQTVFGLSTYSRGLLATGSGLGIYLSISHSSAIRCRFAVESSGGPRASVRSPTLRPHCATHSGPPTDSPDSPDQELENAGLELPSRSSSPGYLLVLIGRKLRNGVTSCQASSSMSQDQ